MMDGLPGAGPSRVTRMASPDLSDHSAMISCRKAFRVVTVGAFVAWWIGDFSPLIAGAPAAMLQARHSRQLESEADVDAARKLEALGVAPSRLADMLERIATAHGERAQDEKEGWTDYLSSHPATRDRIRALRGTVP